MNYYIYILKSKKDGDLYKGFTTDVHKRLDEHNLGLYKFISTKIPWILIYVKEMPDKLSTIIEEKRIKRLNRVSILKLINS